MNIKEIALRIAEKDERIAELETYLKSETKDKESAQESFGTVWSKWQRCEKRIAQLEKQRDELLAALERCRFALEPYDDIKPRDWKSDRLNLRDAHQVAVAAIAGVKGEQ